jgi:hypothetical protein
LAGRRGSGSSAPSAIRTILLHARYRGVYIHGRIKKVRHGGGSVRVKAEPHETIVTEVPEWRIVDDDLWLAVQERLTARGPRAPIGRPPARYALTGIARCVGCGGAIMSAHTRIYGGGHERVNVYACGRHHQRGNAVCPVTVYQRMEDVEGALVEYLQAHMLNERVLEQVLGEIREQIAAQLPKREADVSALEAELRSVRVEQKRLAKAVALADDVPSWWPSCASVPRASCTSKHTCLHRRPPKRCFPDSCGRELPPAAPRRGCPRRRSGHRQAARIGDPGARDSGNPDAGMTIAACRWASATSATTHERRPRNYRRTASALMRPDPEAATASRCRRS